MFGHWYMPWDGRRQWLVLPDHPANKSDAAMQPYAHPAFVSWIRRPLWNGGLYRQNPQLSEAMARLHGRWNGNGEEAGK